MVLHSSSRKRRAGASVDVVQPTTALQLPPPSRGGDDELSDADERQDGYVQRLVLTVPAMSTRVPGTGSLAIGLSRTQSRVRPAQLSFGGFVQSLIAPPASAGCRADAHLLVPISVFDPRDAAQVAAQSSLATVAHVNTRAEVKQLNPQPLYKEQPLLSPASSQSSELPRPSVFAGQRRKRSRTPQPSPTLKALAVDLDASLTGEVLAPATKPLKSRSVSPRIPTLALLPPKRVRMSRSRERSASRDRDFRRRTSAYTAATVTVDNDDERKDSTDDSPRCRPSAFSVVLSRKRPFVRRMTKERFRLQDLMADFGCVLRWDEDDEEKQRLSDELHKEVAESKEPSGGGSVTVESTGDSGQPHDPQRRSRRDRNKRETTDWTRPDNAVVRQDIDRIRRALLSDDTLAAALAAPMPLPLSSAPPSPINEGVELPAQPMAPIDSPKAESIVTVTPPSPVPSLISMDSASPPSSRSVSPSRDGPRSATFRSRTPSPARVSRARTRSRSPAFSYGPKEAVVYHSPPALADITPNTATALAKRHQRTSHSSFLVEAITAHRRPEVSPYAVVNPIQWEADRQQWLRGDVFEYCVRWIGFKQATWESQKNVGEWLVDQYWQRKGGKLWSEEDIDELRQQLPPETNISSAHPANAKARTLDAAHSGRLLLSH